MADATIVTQGTSHRGLHHLVGQGCALVGAQIRHYTGVFVGVGEDCSQEDRHLNCELSKADGHPSVGGPHPISCGSGQNKDRGRENQSLLCAELLILSHPEPGLTSLAPLSLQFQASECGTPQPP